MTARPHEMVSLSGIVGDGIADKRVLLRIDANLPRTLEGDIDTNADWRLRSVVPTIQELKKNNAAVLVMGHLGRPNGVVDPSLSMKPVAERLSALLRDTIHMAPAVLGPDVDTFLEQSASGTVAMLENLRFEQGETENKKEFVERLAGLGDIYVNDAFAASHRKHASIVGVPALLPSAAGLLMEKEIAAFAEVLTEPSRPLVLILGGSKITTKAPVISRFAEMADTIILVGAVANSLLAARGEKTIGQSLAEPVPPAALDVDALLPRDAVVASGLDANEGTTVSIEDVPDDAMIVDIGPETLSSFEDVLGSAGTIVWNGTAGVVENSAFTGGTRGLMDLVISSPATTLIGGGDTVGYTQRHGVLDSFSHVSTGGGAMLDYLARGTLPGIEALRQSTQ